LRAVAVGLVVLNHLWPNRVTGGYVGVDVFFVISGFLITAHLRKEIYGTSKISLARFYARRIKRLLPAAFLVLAVGLVATAIWVPYSEWFRTAREVVMSVLYVENWSLAGQSVDYSALNNDATLAQHYWSLSVEEQFYFIWPLMLYGLYRIGRRWGSHERAMVVGVGTVAIASLVVSTYFTASNPSPAYFVTPVRVWEFAVGGLLALLAPRVKISGSTARIVALLGWLGIVVTAFSFSPATDFPGWVAILPVLATASVIAAGTGRTTAPLGFVLNLKPVRLTGDISYSIYLWHWPMIVVAPYVLGVPLNSWHKLGIMVICFPIAWLSKVLVEDRGKSWRILGEQPRSTFRSMACGVIIMAVLSGGLAWGGSLLQRQDDAIQARQVAGQCSGPAALPLHPSCPNAFGPALVNVMGDANKYYVSPPECAPTNGPALPGVKSVDVCDYSSGDPNAQHVWLTGDSHGEQWKPAIIELARKNHWKLTFSFIGGCPIADVAFTGFRGKATESAKRQCHLGAQSIAARIEQDKPAKVFYSIFAREEHLDDGTGRSQALQYAQGLPKFWSRWAAGGSKVYVLADPPLNGTVRDPKCVVLNAGDPAVCAVPRSVAQPPDPMVQAAVGMGSKAVKVIDLTNHFCDEKFCYSVVGNVVVYFDPDHLNREFSRLASNYIEAQL